MQNPRVIFPALLTSALLCAGELSAHPGALDRNGGHYSDTGGSYHCHMSTCEAPDTFSRGGRDSFFLDQRERDKFYNAADWPFPEDLDGDCQNSRQEMLILTSQAPVTYTNPRNCQVRIGQWLDEYTGQTFTVATQLEMDHIIPPEYAHRHGGDRWPPGRKVMFANDPQNLIPVDRSEMRQKGDRGPARYLPREEYHCSYARQWEAIAEKYDLTLDRRDANHITRKLRECE